MSRTPVFEPVRSDVSIPALERAVLEVWRAEKIFEKSIEQNANGPLYSFYDGPPFATGLPHYGHLMASTQKDIVPRYWAMRGYRIPRRWGWDCHGLPVEYEINKKLGLSSNKEIEALGVAKYNEECRSIVTRYTSEWKKTIERLGRWVDMDNAYFTMNPEFMESVWWVFRRLWDEGYIYEGYKVVPYSTGVSTVLSNFEANLNYKDVQDPAITVTFPVTLNGDVVHILAWTTTPWTLPSNMALAVHRDVDYVCARSHKDGKIYLLAEPLFERYFSKDQDEVVKTLKGEALVGLRYEPLFAFFKDKADEGAFQVIHSDHVTTEDGTGIVHMAPAFGEEDYNACRAASIPIVNPVDDDGMFTSEVSDYQGVRVKAADPQIIEALKEKKRLFRHDTITHSYPFCWRSDTPLIYRAISTWFVKVESMRDRLLESNGKTHWVPEHLRDGRFGKWLENARDWAISRNRFWGTPLPIWKNDEGEMVCVGSIDELEARSGVRVSDLHMESVDTVTIPSKKGGSPLKRTGGVLDCWFESGSMPYAQWGYPKTNKELAEEAFPADFIAEGLDQTRGWFYTLTVLSTALFNGPAFKNVIVNGLILAEDGKKMSKSLKNYPDPEGVLEEYGADALRLYLIDSPVVRAQELRFSEKGVKDVVRKILLRWWNAYSFFVSYANVDAFQPKGDFEKTTNILDRWILSRLKSVVRDTHREMEGYRLFGVVPGLLRFIEELTNTYIRFNRSHFWQEGMPEDKRLAFETLHHVLVTFAKVMAPFTPFMSEVQYRNLSRPLEGARSSVHLEPFPEISEEGIDADLEAAVSRMEQLMLMGRNIREKIKVRAKIPLNSLKIIHRDPKVLDALRPLEPYFKDELNIREVHYLSNEDDFVEISAKANFKILGSRLGPKMKDVARAVSAFTLDQILKLESGESVEAAGESLSLSEVEIRRTARTQSDAFLTHQLLSIELDPSVTEEQILEGLSREVIRRIQVARKNAALNLDDRIEIEVHCEGDLKRALEKHQNDIQTETLGVSLKWSSNPQGAFVESSDVDGDAVTVGIAVREKGKT